MKRINNNQLIVHSKKVRQWLGQNITIITKTNMMRGILTVNLNHNMLDNLPIELVCEIGSFTYKFQHQLKFQPMVQKIEDGTMCVLQTLTIFKIQCGMNPIDDNYQRLDQWPSRMHSSYNKFERNEGTSRYVTPFDIILSSRQLQKNIHIVYIKLEKKLQHKQNAITLF